MYFLHNLSFKEGAGVTRHPLTVYFFNPIFKAKEVNVAPLVASPPVAVTFKYLQSIPVDTSDVQFNVRDIFCNVVAVVVG
jgi:hypothetical protein